MIGEVVNKLEKKHGGLYTNGKVQAWCGKWKREGLSTWGGVEEWWLNKSHTNKSSHKSE